MKEISLVVEDEIYHRLTELKGSRTWREFLLNPFDLPLKPRKIGRPKTITISKAPDTTSDLVCDGEDDQEEIQQAINTLKEPKQTQEQPTLWKCCEKCTYKTKDFQEVTCPKCNGHLKARYI